VGLDIGKFRAKEILSAIAGKVLYDVDMLAASVVAAVGIALRVLIGQHRALRLEHCARHKVLRGDHLQSLALAGDFSLDSTEYIRIKIAKVRGKRSHKGVVPFSKSSGMGCCISYRATHPKGAYFYPLITQVRQ